MHRGRHGQRKHDVGLPIVVGVDRKTGGVHAHQVKCTGSGDPWTTTRIAADVEELGYRGADEEVATADVQRQVVAVRSGETVPMNSSVDNRRGMAELRTQFRECRVLIRTLNDVLERRLNTRIRSSDPAFPWMVEWSAGLITRYVKRELQ